MHTNTHEDAMSRLPVKPITRQAIKNADTEKIVPVVERKNLTIRDFLQWFHSSKHPMIHPESRMTFRGKAKNDVGKPPMIYASL